MSIRHTLSDDGVLEVIVDAPPVNALGLADIASLVEIFEDIAHRPEVKVVILHGEGARGFVGGGDVKEVQSLPGFEGILGHVSSVNRLTVGIHHCAVPVIAAVHGYCIGLGVLLAGSADVVVAEEAARFVLAEVDNGATSGVVQALGLMPEKRLRLAMFTCEPVFGRELAGFGTAVTVTDAADVVGEARRIAGVIASKGPEIMRAMKQTFNGTTRRDIEARFRQEAEITLELNLRGIAREARQTFVSGERKGYLSS